MDLRFFGGQDAEAKHLGPGYHGAGDHQIGTLQHPKKDLKLTYIAPEKWYLGVWEGLVSGVMFALGRVSVGDISLQNFPILNLCAFRRRVKMVWQSWPSRTIPPAMYRPCGREKTALVLQGHGNIEGSTWTDNSFARLFCEATSHFLRAACIHR